MNSRAFPCLVLAFAANMLATGCMPKMTVEEMKAMTPQRPPELDRLEAFVGEWEYTATSTMACLDGEFESTGTGESHWGGDKAFVVNRGVFNMPVFGDDPMEGLETWTYDSHDKVYRSTWVDSMGSSGTGVGRFNEKTNTWTFRASSHGPFGPAKHRGTMKIIDSDTMEWTWTEYAMGGLMKTMEMTGVSRRK